MVIYDPWWNPAVEAQAIDRTHRRPDRDGERLQDDLARAVEEKIWDLQQQKAKTVSDVLGDDDLPRA